MLTLPAVSTPSMHTKEPSTEWQGQDFQEFVPQTFDGQMVRSPHCSVHHYTADTSIEGGFFVVWPRLRPIQPVLQHILNRRFNVSY